MAMGGTRNRSKKKRGNRIPRGSLILFLAATPPFIHKQFCRASVERHVNSMCVRTASAFLATTCELPRALGNRGRLGSFRSDLARVLLV